MSKRFSLGSSSIGDLEKKYVQAVLDSNFISPGPVVAEVEMTCAGMHNKRFGLAVHSGQSAIQLALQAIRECKDIRLKAKYGMRPLVAVPASTYISTLSAAYFAGYEIVLVDVEIPSGNMCPSSLERILWHYKKIDREIDVVLPVHLYGKACNPRIRDICKRYNVRVVEDGCEATFAPGTGWGDILTTSFFSNHLISGGGGGMIMTNNEILDDFCWKLVNHGRSRRFSNDDIYRISEKFHFDTWGHSMKWNDVQAAIVKAQIERKDELYGRRKENADALFSYIWWVDADNNWALLPDHRDHCFMMYPIVLADGFNAKNVIKDLNDNNVEVRRMMPITNQPIVQRYFEHLDLHDEYPNAAKINQQGFYVGVHPELNVSDMREIGEHIVNALTKEAKRVNQG